MICFLEGLGFAFWGLSSRVSAPRFRAFFFGGGGGVRLSGFMFLGLGGLGVWGLGV